MSVSVVEKANGQPTGEAIEILLANNSTPIIFYADRQDDTLTLVRSDNQLAYKLPADSRLTDSPATYGQAE